MARTRPRGLGNACAGPVLACVCRFADHEAGHGGSRRAIREAAVLGPSRLNVELGGACSRQTRPSPPGSAPPNRYERAPSR